MTSRMRDASQSVASAGVNQLATLKLDGDNADIQRLKGPGSSSPLMFDSAQLSE